MPGPQPVAIELDESTRRELESLLGRHSTPQQLALRARIILLAAAGKNHTQIACALNISVKMARLWRHRWHSFGALPLAELSVAERLEDAPRPGAPPTIDAEQVCRIVALACEAPEKSGRPISHWSAPKGSPEIADEIMQRGIVATISPRHAGRLLKRGPCNPIASAIG